MFHVCFRFCIYMHKKQLNTRHLRMDCAQILDPSLQIADWSVLEMLCYINQNEDQNVKSWHLDYFSFFYALRQSCKTPACRGREEGEKYKFILSRDFNHWHLSFSLLFFHDQIFMRKKQWPRFQYFCKEQKHCIIPQLYSRVNKQTLISVQIQ